MASFAKFVTTPADQTASEVSQDGMQLPVETDPSHPDGTSLLRPPSPESYAPSGTTRRDASYASSTVPSAFPPTGTPNSGSSKRQKTPRPIPNLEKTIYSSTQPFNRPPYVDGMIRERISVTGVVRPMEPMEQINALNLDKEDIGLIKEAPVKRYLAGRAIWDRKFKRTYIKVQKERERTLLPPSVRRSSLVSDLFPLFLAGHLKKSMKEEATRITKRVEQLSQSSHDKKASGASSSSTAAPLGVGNFDPSGKTRIHDSPEPETNEGRLERRESMIDVPIGIEGVWDLHGENPPPSSLAGRKDTVRSMFSLLPSPPSC